VTPITQLASAPPSTTTAIGRASGARASPGMSAGTTVAASGGLNLQLN
jgi:hypothetical protein